jgi:hypothetical protein
VTAPAPAVGRHGQAEMRGTAAAAGKGPRLNLEIGIAVRICQQSVRWHSAVATRRSERATTHAAC